MLDVVILIAMPELTQEDFNSLLPLVSSEKQDRIKRFHFFRDAQNCLLGDILSRFEICRATGISNRQLEFSVNAYGKPFLVDSHHVHFNISHAGSYIACAISDEPVGIDIELIKSVNIKIAERFFTPNETAYIKSDSQSLRFCEVWTKKESHIKLEGKGLHKSLSSFSVFDTDTQGYHTYHKAFENNAAICHICSAKSNTPSVKIINTEMFIQSSFSL